MRQQPLWTDEMRARGRRMVETDGMTASEVGEALGVSRNAVIGQAARSGWKFARAATGQAPSREPRLPRNTKPRTPRAPEGTTMLAAQRRLLALMRADVEARAAAEAEETPAGADTGGVAEVGPPPVEVDVGILLPGVSVWEVRDGACRWPVAGEGAETRMCGERVERGSYCGPHARAATR